MNRLNYQEPEPPEPIQTPNFEPHIQSRSINRKSLEFPNQKNGFQIHHLSQKVDKYDNHITQKLQTLFE